YMPDSLHEQVKEHDLPVSSICQRALEGEIHIVEAKAKATDDLAPVVERLSRERVEEASNSYQSGFELGVEWARTRAGWDELSALAPFAGGALLYRDLDQDHSLVGFRFSRA